MEMLQKNGSLKSEFGGKILTHKTSSMSDVDDFKSTPIFKEIQKNFEANGEAYVKDLKGVIGFNVIKGPGGKTCRWIIDGKKGKGSVECNTKKKVNCTITMTDCDLVDLLSGKLDPKSAFFGGKLKISGDMALAMKIKSIMPTKPKL